jgi:hypothetical protein
LADGKTHVEYHNKFWIPSLVFSIIIDILIFRNSFVQMILFESFFVICYWLGENIISPDLDLISINSSDGRLISFGKHVANKLKKIGCVGGIIGFFIGLIPFAFSQWSAAYSYAMSFIGGHRSFWSHSLVLSTLIREIWFDIPFAILLYFVFNYGALTWGWKNIVFETYMDIWLYPLFLAEFIAFTFTDSIHLFLDSAWFKDYNNKK